MDNITFLNTFINKINNIREEEFNKNNFIYKEKNVEKKKVNENLMEYRNYKSNMIKKSIKDKMKPSNIGKKEYELGDNYINILEDDIFTNEDEISEDNKLNIDELTRDDKLKLIYDYLQRKCIDLDECNLKKIECIIDDTNIILKKHIVISKMYQQIIKISFIKKVENGSYIIDLNEKKVKNKNIFFK
jgi:hypothetical protein